MRIMGGAVLGLYLVLVAGCGGDGGGSNPPPGDCAGLTESACARKAGCLWAECATSCNGAAAPGSCQAEGFECPFAGDCSDCSTLDEATCETNPQCVAARCPLCTGGNATIFHSCQERGTTRPIDCAPRQCSSCTGLMATECMAAAAQGCQVGTCSDCDGLRSYAGCYGPGEPPPPCPGFACPPPPGCQGLDEVTCHQTAGCRADYCGDCSGGLPYYGCSDASTPQQCPAFGCPEPVCDGLGEMECQASNLCHPVYAEMMTCDCAEPGCCVQFASCATGDKADCTGPAFCRAATPICGIAGQQSPYVVAYRGDCYEGCALASDCAEPPPTDCRTTGCAPNTTCEACLGATGVEYTCIPAGAAC